MEEDIKTIRKGDPLFPVRLLHYPDMPEVLYLRGCLPPQGPACAVVGARACTSYGRTQAYALGRYLARHGIAVVSGMASGIDGCAQRGALDAGGYSLAVLGCGVDVCYPRSNIELYYDLAMQGGILSEYPPGFRAAPYCFPARNRIISALSDVTVVVEARCRSGSLITADFSLEMGKTVMALPGRIDDDLSAGCNHLIAQGAGIVDSFAAILDEFGISEEKQDAVEHQSGRKEEAAGAGRKDRPTSGTLRRPEERKVLRALSKEPASAGEIAGACGLSLAETRSVLLALMLDGDALEVGAGLFRVKN